MQTRPMLIFTETYTWKVQYALFQHLEQFINKSKYC